MKTWLCLVLSSTIRAVISLVVLAIARLAPACLWNSTAPERASMTIAAFALRCGGVGAAAPAMPAGASSTAATATLARIPAAREVTRAVLSSGR